MLTFPHSTLVTKSLVKQLVKQLMPTTLGVFTNIIKLQLGLL